MNCKKIAIRALVALLCATMLIGMIPLYVSAAEEILVTIGTATVDKATATVTNIADGEYAGDYYIVDIPVTVTQNTTKGFYIGKFDMDVPGTDIIYHSVDMTGAIFRKAQFKGAKTTADASTPKGLVAMFVMDGDNENHTETGLVATMKYMVPVAKEVGEYPVEIVGDPEFVAYDESVSAFTPTTVTNGKIIVTDSSAKTEPKIFTPDTFNFSTGTSLAFAKNTEDATYDFMRVSGNGTGADGSRFVFPTDVEISKLPVMRVVYKANTAGTLSMDVHYTGIPTLTKRMWGFGTAFDASETWTNLYYDFSANRPTGGEDGDAKVVADFDWSKVQKLTKCELRPFGNKGDITGKTLDIAYIGFFADKASAEAYEFASKTPAVVTPVAMYDQDKLSFKKVNYFDNITYSEASKSWTLTAPGTQTTEDNFGFDVNFTDLLFKDAKYAKFGIKLTNGNPVDSDNINCAVTIPNKGVSEKRLWGHGTAMSSAKDTYKELILDINGTNGYTGGDGITGADANADATTTINFLRFKPFGTAGASVTDATVEFTYIAFFSTLEDAEAYVYAPSVSVEYVTVTFMADGKVFYTNDKQVKGEAIVYPTTEPTKDGYTFEGWDVAAGTVITENTTVNAKFVETPVDTGSVVFNAKEFTYSTNGGNIKVAEGKDGKYIYAHFTAAADGKSADATKAQIKFDESAYPKGFTLLNNKFMKLAYRSNVASSSKMDFNPNPVKISNRMWGPKPDMTYDGNWQTLTVDLSTLGWTGGEGFVKGANADEIYKNNFDGIMAGLCLKPYQGNGLDMKADEYFDVLYVGFFDTKEAADAYTFAGFATITIKVEGADDVVLDVVDGDKVTLPAAPEKAGYRFTGWSDGKGKLYGAGQVIEATDLVLTAQFEAATEYYVTYYDEDETTVLGKVTVPADNAKYKHITAPTKDGYKFIGWTIKGTSTIVYSGDSFVGDKELVANYKEGSTNDLSTLINVLKIIKIKKSEGDTKPSGTTESKVLDAKLYTAAQLAEVYQANENFASAGLKTINGVEYAAYTAKQGTYGDDGLNLIFKLEDIADGQKFVDYPVIKFGYYSTASVDAVEPNVIASYQGQDQRTWGASAGTVNGKFAEIVYNYSTALIGNNAGGSYSFSNFDADGTVISPCFKAWGSQTLTVSGNDETFALAYIAFFKNEADAKSYEFGKTVIGEATETPAEETPAEEKPAEETKPAKGAVATYTAAQILTVSSVDVNITMDKEAVSADGTSYAKFSATADGASGDNTKFIIATADLGADFNIKDYPYLAVSYKSNIGVDTTIDFNMRTSYQGSVLRIWGARIDFQRNDKKNTMVIDLANAFNGGEGAAGKDYAWANVDANGICNALWFKPWGGSGGKEMKSGEYFMIEKLAFFADKASAEAFN